MEAEAGVGMTVEIFEGPGTRARSGTDAVLLQVHSQNPKESMSGSEPWEVGNSGVGDSTSKDPSRLVSGAGVGMNECSALVIGSVMGQRGGEGA